MVQKRADSGSSGAEPPGKPRSERRQRGGEEGVVLRHFTTHRGITTCADQCRNRGSSPTVLRHRVLLRQPARGIVTCSRTLPSVVRFRSVALGTTTEKVVREAGNGTTAHSEGLACPG